MLPYLHLTVARKKAECLRDFTRSTGTGQLNLAVSAPDISSPLINAFAHFLYPKDLDRGVRVVINMATPSQTILRVMYAAGKRIIQRRGIWIGEGLKGREKEEEYTREDAIS